MLSSSHSNPTCCLDMSGIMHESSVNTASPMGREGSRLGTANIIGALQFIPIADDRERAYLFGWNKCIRLDLTIII